MITTGYQTDHFFATLKCDYCLLHLLHSGVGHGNLPIAVARCSGVGAAVAFVNKAVVRIHWVFDLTISAV
jgi:hypothetical protein